MDDEIQFGDVEEAQRERRLRPDCNKEYAVVEYEAPNDRDLPVFVDLDTARDMEQHAQSDTRVELGGAPSTMGAPARSQSPSDHPNPD